MDGCRPVTRARFHALVGVVATLLLAPLRAPAAGPSDLVIVVEESSPIRSMSVADVRRVFLGVPLVVAGVDVVPVRNLVEEDLYELFLQRVLFMSAQTYERRMMIRIFQQGGTHIATARSSEELQHLLHTSPGCMSYARRRAVGRGLRIVAEP
jgi:hypothetical protein